MPLYYFYSLQSSFAQQEIFDSKDIKVKRELLDLLFSGLTKEINFPLKSEFKTTISEMNNDSIIISKDAQMLDKFVRNLMVPIDSSAQKEETNLEKLAKNRLVNWSLDMVKGAVDISTSVSFEVFDVINREIEINELSLPEGYFSDAYSFDDFIESIPVANSGGD